MLPALHKDEHPITATVGSIKHVLLQPDVMDAQQTIIVGICPVAISIGNTLADYLVHFVRTLTSWRVAPCRQSFNSCYGIANIWRISGAT